MTPNFNREGHCRVEKQTRIVGTTANAKFTTTYKGQND